MHLQPFLLEDLPDLIELEPADVEAALARMRWHLHTPYSIALKNVFGEALISGVITAVLHGAHVWLGDRYQHPRFRNVRFEQELVQGMLRVLHERGIGSVSVIVRAEEEATFTACGFGVQGSYVRWGQGQCEAPTLDEVLLFEPAHSLGLLRLDATATGESRQVLVSEHSHAARVFVQGHRVLGSYLVLLGEGPIYASNTYAGEELLRWHLFNNPTVCVPSANAAAATFLQERGYAQMERFIRMVHGDAPAWQPTMEFAWAGSMWG